MSNKKKKERKRDRDRKKERERKEGGKQSIESVMIGLWNGKKLCWFFFLGMHFKIKKNNFYLSGSGGAHL